MILTDGRNRKARWLGVAAALLPALAYAQQELPQMAISKSGKEIPWSQFDPDDLGEKEVVYSEAGLRPISPAPPAGVHPRILLSPADVPDLRRRLSETQCGREIMLNLRAWTAHLNGTYDDTADYAQVPEEILGGAERPRGARVPLQRGNDIAKHYAQLVAGSMEGIEISLGSMLPAVMALEAFECFLTDNAERGQRLAKAMTTICRTQLPKIEPTSHVGVIGGHNMGLCYDFAYKFMTEAQRDIVRQALAKTLAHPAHYGTFIEPEATTSNWCTLDSFMVLTNLALEGEPGFNENYYRGAVRAFRNFLTYGWYPSGVGYEGGGKNYQFVTTLVAFAKRGVNLPAHPHVRAYGTRFLPSAMLPFGNGFSAYDDWGGTGWDTVKGGYRFNFNDAIGLKWVFPDDPTVDFVWRNWIGEHYEHVPTRPEGYFNAMLMAALFASDWTPGEWDAAKAAVPRTFFCGERGLLITRSDWSKEALYLHLHCRQDLGGHTSAERNSFLFCALGRIWGRLQTMAGGSELGKMNETRFHSCVLIDDVGQSGNGEGSNRVPGKMVAFKDDDLATFACGDASNAYSWTWAGQGAGWQVGDDPEWEPVKQTPNDFRYTKGAESYLNKPWFDWPHWLQPGEISRICRKAWNPVKRAFRTAGIVRGKHPYALIVDDIQKDDAVHNYKWLMQLSADLEVAPDKLGYRYDAKNRIGDVTLCGRECRINEEGYRYVTTGDPLLLVRVLDCTRDPKLPHRTTEVGAVEEYMAGIRWFQKGKQLVIPSWSVSPNYKVMLFPYHHGEELPTTTWSKNRTRLTLEWKDQREEYDFSTGEDGRTRFVLTREGAGAFALE